MKRLLILVSLLSVFIFPIHSNAAYTTTLEAELFDGLSMYSSNESGVTQLYFYNNTALNYGLMSAADYERVKSGEGFSATMSTMVQNTNLIPGRAAFVDVEETLESLCQKITKPTTSDAIISRAVRSDMLLSEAFPGILETNQFKGVLFNGSAPGKMNLPMVMDGFQIASAIASANQASVKSFITNNLGKIESQAKAVVGTITALQLLLDPAADMVGVLSLGKYSSDLQQWRDNLDAIQNGIFKLMPAGSIDNNLFAFNADAFEKALVDPNTGKSKVSYLKLLASLGAPTESNKQKIKLWISIGNKKEKKVAAIVLAVDAANRVFRLMNSWHSNQQLTASDTLELLKFIAVELVTDYAQYSLSNAVCAQAQDEFAKLTEDNKWFHLVNLLNVSAGKAWSEASRPSEIYFTVRRNPETGKLSVDHSVSNLQSRGYSLLQAPSGESSFDQRYILQPSVVSGSFRTSMLVAEYPQEPIVMLARQGLKVAPQVLISFPKSSTDVNGYFDATAGDDAAIYVSLKNDLLGKSSTSGQYIWANLVNKTYNQSVSFSTAASTTNLFFMPIKFDLAYARLEEKALGLASDSYNITNFSNINSQNIFQKGDVAFNSIGGYKVSIDLKINKVDSITNGIPSVSRALQQQGEFRFYVLPNYNISQAPGMVATSEIIFDGGRKALFISNTAAETLTGFRRTLSDGNLGWQARIAVQGTDGVFQRINSKGFEGVLDGKQGFFLPIPDNFFKAPIQSVALYDPLIDAYSDLESVEFDEALKSALVMILSDAGTSQLASAVEIPWYRLNKTGDTLSPSVTATPAGGTFEGAQQVTINTSEPATVYYTTNGSSPTESSSIYSAPLTFSSTTALKFMAVDSVGNKSAVKSYNYEIKNFSTTPYLQITVPNRIKAAFNAQDSSFYADPGDEIGLQVINVSPSPIAALAGQDIKVVVLMPDDSSKLVNGTLSGDKISFTIATTADGTIMPAGRYQVIAFMGIDVNGDRHVPGPYELKQLSEKDASQVGGGGGGGSTSGTITLPRTGQYRCYDTAGTEIPCAGTGQDGDIQAGKRWSTTPRFTDNGDQTMTDTVTGLIWTKDGNAPGPAACAPHTTKTWKGALDYVDCLNINNFLNHNDWRLPNQMELKSIIVWHQAYLSTWLTSQGFSNVLSTDFYWSSSSLGNSYNVWSVMSYGAVTFWYSTLGGNVWPVRGGQ